MSYSVINWGAFTPLPYDGTMDLATLHSSIAAGYPSEGEISGYWQNGLNAARALHDVYDPTGEHPERFKRLDETVIERTGQWTQASDSLERFLVADRLNYSMGVAYDLYRAKLGDHASIAELLSDGARIAGKTAGAVAGGLVGGVVGGFAGAIPWYVLAIGGMSLVGVIVIVIVK